MTDNGGEGELPLPGRDEEVSALAAASTALGDAVSVDYGASDEPDVSAAPEIVTTTGVPGKPMSIIRRWVKRVVRRVSAWFKR